VAAKLFILQGGTEPLSSVPVWAEPSQSLIGMWARTISFRTIRDVAPRARGLPVFGHPMSLGLSWDYQKVERGDQIEGKRRRINVIESCYTPTVATTSNSKASAAVRETRNTTICPLNMDPAIECAELKTTRTGGVRTEILKGYSIADFVCHDGEFG
jgi:hypothetical protein